MPPRGTAPTIEGMPEPLPITTRKRKSRPVDPDGPIRWACSGKGWNCCVGVGIQVRPYDMLRLRHATGRSSQELVNDATVTFEWEPASGILYGRLAHRAYEGGRVACVFLDELTNLDVRQIRDEDPPRFEALPAGVRRTADSAGDREWKVAGLCGVHSGRPEVCRGFPYQRLAAPDASAEGSEVHQVFRCGSCALPTPTTPRDVLEGESLAEHWRADDAFRQLCRYLHSVGAANSRDPAYRHLIAEPSARLEFWASLYVVEAHPTLGERARVQGRSELDIEGDRELYHALLSSTLDRVDSLVEASGLSVSELGMPGDEIARPDLEALLDPARELLPQPAAARRVT